MTRPHYITPDIEDTLPLFRRTDPATSKAAAATVKTFAGEHHQAILEALSHGPAGASGHRGTVRADAAPDRQTDQRACTGWEDR
jgi:hypothetical protein